MSTLDVHEKVYGRGNGLFLLEYSEKHLLQHAEFKFILIFTVSKYFWEGLVIESS